jgi:hypothetical protein
MTTPRATDRAVMSDWTKAWIIALLSAITYLTAGYEAKARARFALEVALYAVLLRLVLAVVDGVSTWAAPRVARLIRRLRERAGMP